jgi:hypothetical protein
LRDATTFATIDAQISLYDFGAELIVAGFGRDDEGPSILTVKNPGIVVDHTQIGFWCIGSGATAAQMSLFARTYSWSATPEMAAFYLFEAKMNAQTAAGVGITTDIYLIKRNVMPIRLQQSTIDKLSGIFDDIKPKQFSAPHQDKLAEAVEFTNFSQL